MRASTLILGLFAFPSPVCLAVHFPQSEHTIGIERIIGENNLEAIEEGEGTDYYEMGRAVARVEMNGGLCTGFRVGEDLIMTNNHCYSSCSTMMFRFGYERNLGRDSEVVFKCIKALANDSDLDYALFRVELDSGNRPDDYPPVTLSKATLDEGDLLFIAGHPAGRRKEMDRSENCKLISWPSGRTTSLEHSCDTEGGNSGSSVFARASGHVIGIHWGYTNYNRATVMKKVLAHIESTAPAAYEELSIAD